MNEGVLVLIFMSAYGFLRNIQVVSKCVCVYIYMYGGQLGPGGGGGQWE